MANYLEEIEQLSLSVEDIGDEESPIVIDTFTRNVVFGDSFNKQIAVEGDLSSNEITFICPRYIEGYDISQVRHIYVIWNNKNAGTNGAYLVKRDFVDGNEDNLCLPWLISSEVAKVAGSIECSISFIDYADTDGTIVSYKWSTNPITDLYVGTGVPNKTIDEAERLDGDIPYEGPIREVTSFELIDSEPGVSFTMFERDFVFEPNINTQIAVEGDNYSSIVTFNIAQDNADYKISQISGAFVKWKIGEKSGYDTLIRDDEIHSKYYWTISHKMTEKAGTVTFNVCFLTADGSDDIIISRWNSNPCSVLTIGKGVPNSDIDSLERLNSLDNTIILQEELTNMLQEVFGT